MEAPTRHSGNDRRMRKGTAFRTPSIEKTPIFDELHVRLLKSLCGRRNTLTDIQDRCKLQNTHCLFPNLVISASSPNSPSIGPHPSNPYKGTTSPRDKKRFSGRLVLIIVSEESER